MNNENNKDELLEVDEALKNVVIAIALAGGPKELARQLTNYMKAQKNGRH